LEWANQYQKGDPRVMNGIPAAVPGFGHPHMMHPGYKGNNYYSRA